MGDSPGRMGLSVSTCRAEFTHSVEITPTLANELAAISIRHRKLLEQRALEAQFSEQDAEEARELATTRTEQVNRLVESIEKHCSFRPTEEPYRCAAERDDCLRCF